jgi:hypothetical protein
VIKSSSQRQPIATRIGLLYPGTASHSETVARHSETLIIEKRALAGMQNEATADIAKYTGSSTGTSHNQEI